MRPCLQAVALLGLLLALPRGGNGRSLLLRSIGRVEQQQGDAEFRRLAERLSQQRLGGGEESEKLQEQALKILDVIAVQALSAPGDPDLAPLNQRLAALVTRQPAVGEDYRLVRLGGTPAAYVLVANFGLGGPSAVRVYSSTEGHYALTARIDRYAQSDFFDEYLEVVPIAGPGALFVTVVGRTDDLQTGVFTAWRVEDGRVRAVWRSEILQQSSYEARADGFRLTYCAETDESNPRACRRMTRDRYAWDGATWKRVESRNLGAGPVPKQ